MTAPLTLIIQNNGIYANTIPMVEAAHDLGIPVVDLSLSFKPDRVPAFEGAPFVYGSVGMIKWALKQPELSAHVLWNEDALSSATWKRELGDLYLNSDGHACLAGEAPAGWHVRPVRNDKTFSGSIVPVANEHATIAAWTAPPKVIDEEVRVFLVDHRFVQASIYRRNGLDHREQCAAPDIPAGTWAPFPNCVMDLALVAGRWRIIEFNSIHSSGLYDCDPSVVLTALQVAQEGGRDTRPNM